jgi:hypothetical protein
VGAPATPSQIYMYESHNMPVRHANLNPALPRTILKTNPSTTVPPSWQTRKPALQHQQEAEEKSGCVGVACDITTSPLRCDPCPKLRTPARTAHRRCADNVEICIDFRKAVR